MSLRQRHLTLLTLTGSTLLLSALFLISANFLMSLIVDPTPTVTSLLPPRDDYLRRTLREGDTFAPGSLPYTRVETSRKCFVDPTKYKRNFAQARCSIADQWNLVYHLVPKSGSSTGRHVMKESFDAYEKNNCHQDLARHDDDKHHFTSVREPLNRFYASYEEMFVRRLGRPQEVPTQYRNFMKAYNGMEYKEYEGLFGTPEGVNKLTRSFEDFVKDYDLGEVFDEHLSLQMAPFVNSTTGQALWLDGMIEVDNLESQFGDLARKVNAPLPKVIRGRAYPRRFNVSDINDEIIRKICQLTAIDYCCLNFPLPPACAEAIGDELVQCRWISKLELSDQLMIEAISPYPTH